MLGLDIAASLAFSICVLEQLTILAPGLLGGSVARAAHARKLAKRIVIWARRPEVRDQLRAQPWCNQVFDTPEDAVRSACLVVLAAPVEKIVELARQIAPALPPGAIVTDVGSVKSELCRACTTAMPSHATFVGSHPMAGSQKTGWENSTENLFEGRTCFVTPLAGTPSAAIETVASFWREVGSNVATLTPDQHDEIVAHISHLPQAIATTLCSFLAQKKDAWRDFAGGGLRDTTRIAASDATMWIEIFQQNRDEILRALNEFQNELHGFSAALANREWDELRTRLESGKTYRDGFKS
ncbi:MAG: prephenate dehydrogenase/arogenate dehydrogenase family protein [Verrucomicrobia bacterium]|nr:prephenate dehydrogenase/arogenate dehydrogenase family protein [Verrucomicrobiota bacterium]